MPTTKRALPSTAHIDAVLDEVRMFAERAQMVDTRLRVAGTTMQIVAKTQSNVGVGIVESPESGRRLLVNHTYTVSLSTMVADGSTEALCEYESDYRALFEITASFGVDLTQAPPVQLVQTYINQIAWFARTRATGTFSQMGLGGVILPKVSNYAADQAPPATSAVRKRRAKTGG